MSEKKQRMATEILLAGQRLRKQVEPLITKKGIEAIPLPHANGGGHYLLGHIAVQTIACGVHSGLDSAGVRLSDGLNYTTYRACVSC